MRESGAGSAIRSPSKRTGWLDVTIGASWAAMKEASPGETTLGRVLDSGKRMFAAGVATTIRRPDLESAPCASRTMNCCAPPAEGGRDAAGAGAGVAQLVTSANASAERPKTVERMISLPETG